MSGVHKGGVVAGSTFGFGGLFPLLCHFLLGAIFLVSVGGVVLVVVVLLGLVRVIFVSLVNVSACSGWRGESNGQNIRL